MQTAAPNLFLERSVALKHRPVRALLDEVLEVDEQAPDVDVLPSRRGAWWVRLSAAIDRICETKAGLALGPHWYMEVRLLPASMVV